MGLITACCKLRVEVFHAAGDLRQFRGRDNNDQFGIVAQEVEWQDTLRVDENRRSPQGHRLKKSE